MSDEQQAAELFERALRVARAEIIASLRAARAEWNAACGRAEQFRGEEAARREALAARVEALAAKWEQRPVPGNRLLPYVSAARELRALLDDQ